MGLPWTRSALLLLVTWTAPTWTALAHNDRLVTVSVGGTPGFDATCGSEFGDALHLKISGPETPVVVKRDSDALWICVSAIFTGSSQQTISVYIDLDHTGPVKPQASNIALTVNREAKAA